MPPIAALVLVLALAACAPSAEQPAPDSPATPAVGGQLYGAELALAEPIAIADLLATPEEFIGKPVQIKGTAVHVCKHSGKRLRVMDPESQAAIMVDFATAGLEFPAETLNHTIVAEGTLIRRDLSPQHAEDDHDHAADEPHDEAEHASAEAGEDCAAEAADATPTNVVYVIEGSGARDLDLQG